ncbi:MAG TPA: phosphoglucomutase/phosphomannomutase family protein [Candidatus Wallbacteria bacterium]|nr:phosphoglucomutase/phosphomannomutase family protein [Candidatus Wallbacteria bacterium]
MSIKFGTDGWRAIMAEEFTFANVRMVAYAIAKYVKDAQKASKGVVIGYDTRFLSDKFAETCARVLLGADIKVLLMERDAPTPVTAFTAVKRNTAGAIMLTASHNPPYYNGMKFIPEYGGPASPQITAQIESNLQTIMPNEKILEKSIEKGIAEKMLEKIDPSEDYFEKITSLIDFETIKKAQLSVAFDPIYGTGRNYVDALLSRNQISVRVIHNMRDPLFGGGMPEPSVEYLSQLISIVKDNKLALGLATDGDADRFGVVDSLGVFLTPNQLISIIFLHLIKRRKFQGAVVRTVATTHLIDKIAEKFDIPVHETPVGFKYICEKMLSENIIIGGEESGGLSILGHIPEKDGILANLLACEVAAIENKPLSVVYKNLLDEFGEVYTDRINIHLKNDEQKNSIMHKLKVDPPSFIMNVKVNSINDVDGYKFLLKDGSWVLVRASGTEPVLRIYIEGTSKDMLRKLQKFAEDIQK